jgi:hypothetical protein
MAFIADGLASDDWSASLRKHYGVPNVAQMQTVWLDWVKQGCPAPPATIAAVVPATQPGWTPTTRGQSPDPVAAAPTPAAIAATPGRKSIYAMQARRAGEDSGTVAR